MSILLVSSLKAQQWFSPIDTNFAATATIIPQGYQFQALLTAGDTVVRADGVRSPSRSNNDLVVFIPIAGSTTDGYLYVAHETNNAYNALGDGGGATVFKVMKSGTQWSVVGEKYHVDFSAVGGTWLNCAGTLSPWGTVLTAEEFPPTSNSELYRGGNGVRDTSDFGGYKRYLNYGWIVEVDPLQRRALRKLWGMGRYSHESLVCMPDRRTVYLTDDFVPSVFFKFVASSLGDYQDGQLYAYRQSSDGTSGDWIRLPMQRDSLNVIRDIAIQKGATIFLRFEDLELAPDGMLYIAETGAENVDLGPWVARGGRVALHLEAKKTTASRYHDPYGRILRFDPGTDAMRSYLEGGAASTNANHLSNPDNLSIHLPSNSLVIHEDLIGISQGRNPAWVSSGSVVVNEVYVLDLGLRNPRVDDLRRFLIGPRGSETTGPWWIPDFTTYFLSIQHPHGGNPPPFHQSTTIALSASAVTGVLKKPSDIAMPVSVVSFPHPISRSTTVRFRLPTQGYARLRVYNSLGQVVALLVDGHWASGEHAVEWHPQLASGLYVYRLESEQVYFTGKFVVVK